jgi:UDP-N-acetylglucosamine 4,6-dehydratase
MNKLNFKHVFNRNLIKPNINFKLFVNKSILVTGSSGSIGTKIIKKLKKYTKDITLADINGSGFAGNVDMTKKSSISKFKKKKFDFAFHLAADKRADFAEVNPDSVSMLNILSTSNITKLNIKKIVLGSTCKAANPITSYGASKLICERVVLNKGGNVARFVNVFDTSSSVTKIWGKINKKEKIPVTPCKRFFITLEEAVNLLLFTATMPTGRYSYRNLKKIHMKDVAKKIYPKRKIASMKLRFGDRPVETLIGKTEKIQNINKQIIRIVDCWGK